MKSQFEKSGFFKSLILRAAKWVTRQIEGENDSIDYLAPQTVNIEKVLVHEKVFRFNTPPQINLKQMFLRRGYLVDRVIDQTSLARLLNKLKPINIQEGLVRVGGNGDGGYLIPNNLGGISACFSPGVAENADFEKELFERFGIQANLADYSVDAAPVIGENYHFTKKFLGRTNDDIFMRLEDWVGDRGGANDGQDLILQMDIEGAEYAVILDTPKETLQKFRILVIEFHDLDQLFSRSGFSWLEAVLDSLLEEFTVVHLHPNNCCPVWKLGEIEIPTVMEMTFYRNDHIVETGEPVIYPHPLDETNVPSRDDIALAKCWGVVSRS